MEGVQLQIISAWSYQALPENLCPLRITLLLRKRHIWLLCGRIGLEKAKKRDHQQASFLYFKVHFIRLLVSGGNNSNLGGNFFMLYKVSGWGRGENLVSSCLNRRRGQRRGIERSEGPWGHWTHYSGYQFVCALWGTSREWGWLLFAFISRAALWCPLKRRSIISAMQNKKAGKLLPRGRPGKWFLGPPLLGHLPGETLQHFTKIYINMSLSFS